jgi:1-phosphofructokinase
MILTVTVNASLNRTYATGPLRSGEVNRARSDGIEAGGMGVNVSRVLHSAGAQTLAVVMAGGYEGEQLMRLLGRDRLPHVVVPTVAPTRTNVTITEPGGRTTTINSPGYPPTGPECAALVRTVATHASSASWVVCGGSLPPGTDTGIMARLIDAARRAGARTAINASGDALVAAADGGADLLAPSVEELGGLVGRELTGSGRGLVADASAAAAEVVARSGGALLVGLAADGAVWVDADRALHAAAVTPVNPAAVPPVNPAGDPDAPLAGDASLVGDALLAGWVYADGEPAARLARAVAWSALS